MTVHGAAEEEMTAAREKVHVKLFTVRAAEVRLLLAEASGACRDGWRQTSGRRMDTRILSYTSPPYMDTFVYCQKPVYGKSQYTYTSPPQYTYTRKYTAYRAARSVAHAAVENGCFII